MTALSAQVPNWTGFTVVIVLCLILCGLAYLDAWRQHRRTRPRRDLRIVVRGKGHVR